MVEFALIGPIFFLLVFSIITLGIVFGGQNGLVAAAREYARYAAPYHVKTLTDATQVCADTRLGTQLTGFLRQSIPGYDPTNVVTRSVTYSTQPNADGTTKYVQLRVDLVYRFPVYVPLVGAVIDRFDGTSDNKLQLEAHEIMRIENEDLTGSDFTKSCTI